MRRTLGIDLDNTIIDYSLAFSEIARVEYPQINFESLEKNHFKDELTLSLGEAEWTSCQSRLYGEYIRWAKPHDGFHEALEKIYKLGWDVKIISHKSQYSISDNSINLREPALNWITEHVSNLFPIEFNPENDVLFADSVAHKIKLIVDTGCNAFIDDLQEILLGLPIDVTKYWIFPDSQPSSSEIRSLPVWSSLDLNEFK
jgi:hypothetical protein